MTDVNHDLFVKVLTQIEREPKLWDQRSWNAPGKCGTSYCMAGWAAVLSGREFADYGVIAGPRPRWVVPVAEELLRCKRFVSGTFGGDDDLFSPYNTLDDLYRISARRMGIDETVLRDKVRAEAAS